MLALFISQKTFVVVAFYLGRSRFKGFEHRSFLGRSLNVRNSNRETRTSSKTEPKILEVVKTLGYEGSRVFLYEIADYLSNRSFFKALSAFDPESEICRECFRKEQPPKAGFYQNNFFPTTGAALKHNGVGVFIVAYGKVALGETPTRHTHLDPRVNR